MEYLIVLIGCIITIAILYVVFEVNIKEIKKVGKNEKLDELTKKFPENEEICKDILKKLKNENVKVVQNENRENKTSLYIAISNTILIANIKDTYTRIQTIAHECLHSIQSRKMLLFNFFYSNFYLIYFVIITLLTVVGVIKNYYLNIAILILLSYIYYIVRSYLETDAMTKARYVAKDYMNDYIENNEICTKDEINDLCEQYDKINKIGIPATNFVIFFNCFIKVTIYVAVAFIKSI